MEELMRQIIVHKHFLIAMATALVGAVARIGYEKETKKVSIGKQLGFMTAALFTGYLVFSLADQWGYENLIGPVSAVAGLISVDIRKWLIEYIPTRFKDLADKYIGNKTTQTHDEGNNDI